MFIFWGKRFGSKGNISKYIFYKIKSKKKNEGKCLKQLNNRRYIYLYINSKQEISTASKVKVMQFPFTSTLYT